MPFTSRAKVCIPRRSSATSARTIEMHISAPTLVDISFHDQRPTKYVVVALKSPREPDRPRTSLRGSSQKHGSIRHRLCGTAQTPRHRLCRQRNRAASHQNLTTSTAPRTPGDPKLGERGSPQAAPLDPRTHATRPRRLRRRRTRPHAVAAKNTAASPAQTPRHQRCREKP